MARKLSSKAYLYCMQTNFENFLRAQNVLIPEWASCKEALKQVLRIKSLSELDNELNTDLTHRYQSLINKFHQDYFDKNPQGQRG